MCNAFCLPITLKVLPRKWLTAVIVALHGAPLLALWWLVDGELGAGWLLAVTAVVGGSLLWELRRQSSAGAATKLVATRTNEWLLYRGAQQWQAQRQAKSQAQQYVKVEMAAHLDCIWFVVLLMAQQRRKFRLLIPATAQADGQLHRLRLWMKRPPDLPKPQ